MKQVSRWQFMTELNRRLREHPQYRPGMAFVAFPLGTGLRAATGFCVVPAEATELAAPIVAKASREFEVVPGGERGPRATELTQFISDRNRASEAPLADVLLAMMDVFDEIRATGVMGPEHVAAVVAGMSHPARLVSSNTYESIWWLQHRGVECGPVLHAAIASPERDVRYLALCCVHHETSRETSEAVLAQGLADKGASVRGRAARQACERGKRWMLPQVQAALAVETNANARADMENAVKFMQLQLEKYGP